MRRMNLRDIPDEVYATLVDAAARSHQSLSAFAVARLTEAAQVAKLEDYLTEFQATEGSGVSLEDAAQAVRDVREAS